LTRLVVGHCPGNAKGYIGAFTDPTLSNRTNAVLLGPEQPGRRHQMENGQRLHLMTVPQDIFQDVSSSHEQSVMTDVEAGADETPVSICIVRYEWERVAYGVWQRTVIDCEMSAVGASSTFERGNRVGHFLLPS
jgi:hypothetical protein